MIEIKCTEKEKNIIEQMIYNVQTSICKELFGYDSCCCGISVYGCGGCVNKNIKFDIQPDKLKPCPFCGGNNIELIKDRDKVLGRSFRYRCGNCGSETKLKTTENYARNAWQSRYEK